MSIQSTKSMKYDVSIRYPFNLIELDGDCKYCKYSNIYGAKIESLELKIDYFKKKLFNTSKINAKKIRNKIKKYHKELNTIKEKYAEFILIGDI